MPNTIDSSVSTSLALLYPAERLVQIASDGTAWVAYYNGTTYVFRTASSPYSSWSSTTTIATAASIGASSCIDGSDNIWVCYKDTSGPNLLQVKLTKSGSTWTVGTANTVASGNFGGSRQASYIFFDQSSRLWVISYEFGSADNWEAFYSTNSGTSWTTSLSTGTSLTIANTSEALVALPVGKYILVTYANSDGALRWRRLDTTGTLTAWTTEAATGTGVNLWNDYEWSLAVDTNGKAVLASGKHVTDAGQAIRTLLYTPGTDSWGSQTDIGDNTTDTDPTLINANGTVYCFWSRFSASNNYSIVYKTWNGSAWSSETTLIASGSNRLYANAGYGHSTIGIIDLLGTANPWTIEWSSISLATSVPPSSTLGLMGVG